MPGKSTRRDLLDIAIDAYNGDLQAGEDLEWFISWRIRWWERANTLALMKPGLVATYGRFDA